MWIKPGHHPKPAASPPRERGRRLATLPRGQGEELRVSLDEFNGHEYLALRVWSRGQDGGWWPVSGKGLSIRLRELGDVAEALRAAEDLTSGPEGSTAIPPGRGEGGPR